jgi:hypothetical protein
MAIDAGVHGSHTACIEVQVCQVLGDQQVGPALPGGGIHRRRELHDGLHQVPAVIGQYGEFGSLSGQLPGTVPACLGFRSQTRIKDSAIRRLHDATLLQRYAVVLESVSSDDKVANAVPAVPCAPCQVLVIIPFVGGETAGHESRGTLVAQEPGQPFDEATQRRVIRLEVAVRWHQRVQPAGLEDAARRVHLEHGPGAARSGHCAQHSVP